MKITSFEEFKELAQRGTFVPVCKEIVADLLTPVSAFLKIAEHADYAFLLESVEGGEHVARYSFLGKDPFLILRSRGGKTTLERAAQTTETDRPFIETLRTLMADFRSPFVPDLPRFTGGAVGYLGYGAASWFEPVLGDLGGGTDGSDQAGFMLFDTVLAFDHVQHRILIIANARITADDDLESLYQALPQARFLYLTTKAERFYTDWTFQPDDCLVFGRETRGLPEELLRANWDRCLKIPMLNSNVRSLNLATAVGIVLFEALRQTNTDFHGQSTDD